MNGRMRETNGDWGVMWAKNSNANPNVYCYYTCSMQNHCSEGGFVSVNDFVGLSCLMEANNTSRGYLTSGIYLNTHLHSG